MKKINLTIQEIVRDYESLIRYDERLSSYFDVEKAGDEDIDLYYRRMLQLIEKYLPTYEKNIDEEYFSNKTSTYEKALMLYAALYENFREIFYQLV